MKTPRFCGVELKPVFHAKTARGAFEGEVHGAHVRVWLTTRGWLSDAYFSAWGISLPMGIHAESAAASLLSLRGSLRNLQRKLALFEPKKRTCKECSGIPPRHNFECSKHVE